MYPIYLVDSLISFEFFTGIQTSQDARFYGISAKFEPFSNEGKALVIQFTVKHEQNLDCGGGYAKLFTHDLNQKDMHGDTPYLIMFGKYFKKVPLVSWILKFFAIIYKT
jgi:hypothetical protein